MGFQDKLKNICMSLGTNNKPTYVVMAIAAVKGIARPTFTMMDKTESPETKKYTALREGLTEAIAIPAYFICGELAGMIAKKIQPQDMAKKAHKNLMFVGVCTAALFVIPALCSVAIKPIMDAMHMKSPGDKSKPNTPKTKLDIQSNSDISIKTTNPVIKPDNKFPQLSTYTSRPQTGLKVGGL